jgi:hypothetical protein
VLLENSNDLNAVAEALVLLNGLENMPSPPAPSWLAEWCMARQVEAASRVQVLTATRLCILVDGKSFSATDTFLDLLTSQLPPDRIHTVGRPSKGGIGGPALLGELHNTKAAFNASTCRAYSLDGQLLEGHPARIDVPVTWTRATDPDLEAALKVIALQK